MGQVNFRMTDERLALIDRAATTTNKGKDTGSPIWSGMTEGAKQIPRSAWNCTCSRIR